MSKLHDVEMDLMMLQYSILSKMFYKNRRTTMFYGGVPNGPRLSTAPPQLSRMEIITDQGKSSTSMQGTRDVILH